MQFLCRTVMHLFLGCVAFWKGDDCSLYNCILTQKVQKMWLKFMTSGECRIYHLFPWVRVVFYFLLCFVEETTMYVPYASHNLIINCCSRMEFRVVAQKLLLDLPILGFGDTLLAATQTLHGNKLTVSLHTWRENLCLELALNSHGFLPCCQSKLLASIPESFPNIDVLLLYLRPLVSPSSAIFQLCAWISQNICMWTLAALCERTFSWGGAMEITTILFGMVSSFGNYWRFDTQAANF